MRIKLHQDIELHKAGETVDVPESRARFYIAEGYASTAADREASNGPTSVEDPKLDPRRAENVKAKPATPLAEQMADGLGLLQEPKADPVGPAALDRPEPIEATNGKGDREKAESGKVALEQKAVKQDPAEAPEEQA